MLLSPPSPWVKRFAPLVRAGGSVLDVACGSGRHLQWLAAQRERGWRLTGVDRDAAAVEPLRAIAEIVVADLENGPWPLPGRRFDGIVVTHYLWRPLLPTLIASLAAGGVLIYETFTQGQQTLGKPSNPDFLLAPGELLAACAGLRIVAFEDGFESGAGAAPAAARYVQRIAAVAAADPPPARYGLDAPAR